MNKEGPVLFQDVLVYSNSLVMPTLCLFDRSRSIQTILGGGVFEGWVDQGKEKIRLFSCTDGYVRIFFRAKAGSSTHPHIHTPTRRLSHPCIVRELIGLHTVRNSRVSSIHTHRQKKKKITKKQRVRERESLLILPLEQRAQRQLLPFFFLVRVFFLFVYLPLAPVLVCLPYPLL